MANKEPSEKDVYMDKRDGYVEEWKGFRNKVIELVENGLQYVGAY